MEALANNKEVIFLKNASNLYYFSGLNNPDAYILIFGKEKYYYTDDRYLEQAKNNADGFIVRHISCFMDEIKKISIHVNEMGIEDDLPYFFSQKLKTHGIQKFYSISERIAILRANKTEKEKLFIEKAQDITDRVFSIILDTVKEGMTEKELAAILESELYAKGSDGLAFRSIVAFDENTSIPHAERSEKRLKKGSIITLDFGAKYQNYCSDMTRTFFFGKPDDEIVKMYNVVLSAQKKAIEEAHVGMFAKECDGIARNYFAERGLDKFFLHSLGHGVGIDIHEYPGVSSRSSAILENNMLITIEPGLYFTGKYGIRIEDMIIFDKTGVINLTKSPKNIIIV